MQVRTDVCRHFYVSAVVKDVRFHMFSTKNSKLVLSFASDLACTYVCLSDM